MTGFQAKRKMAADKQAVACKHARIVTFFDEETNEPIPLWACTECGCRFEPLTQRQLEQEPVAWELRAGKTDRILIEITNNPQRAHDWKASLAEVVPLYTSPPQRQPLTDEQINAHRLSLSYDLEDLPDPWAFAEGVRAAERAHRIGEQA